MGNSDRTFGFIAVFLCLKSNCLTESTSGALA